MGKRCSNCIEDPLLIQVNDRQSSRRKMSLSSCSNAALTLLALKQESTPSNSPASSVTGYGSSSCSIQSNLTSSDDRRPSLSICSSVTDDDGSITDDELGTSNSSKSATSGYELIRMALVRPKLRIVSVADKVVPTLNIPTWTIPPVGRPLPAPGRFPRGLVIPSELNTVNEKK
jgi:hypothetical protein